MIRLTENLFSVEDMLIIGDEDTAIDATKKPAGMDVEFCGNVFVRWPSSRVRRWALRFALGRYDLP